MAVAAPTPISIPFLTAVDPEMAVKGSIDPLGLLPLWSTYGREVVGNLTTIASNTPGFTTLILGCHLARRLVDDHGLPESRFCDAFLIFEQLAGYSRQAWRDETGDVSRILGIRRIRTRLLDGRGGQVPIGLEREAQIMSNQKQYGLWGMFRVSAQDSGLFDRQGLSLTEPAESFVRRELIPRLEKEGPRDATRMVLRFMAGKAGSRFAPEGRHSELARAIAFCHRPNYSEAERSFYQQHLVEGGTSFPDGRQSRFWELMLERNDEHQGWSHPFGMAEIRDLLAEALRREDPVLPDVLDRILRFETLAAPSTRLFGFLQNVDGRDISSVAEEIRSVWGSGLRHLDPEGLAPHLHAVRRLHGEEGVARFLDLATALEKGDYRTAVMKLLEQNLDVSTRRGSGPWVVLDEGRRLRVRYRQENPPLPEADQLESLWVHSYFINSLKHVGAQVFNKQTTPPEEMEEV